MGIMEIYALVAFLIYAATIVAGIIVVIAIWRGMKAHERMADSVARMADVTERIEENFRRNQTV
jgi:hypothetical protein